MSTIPRRIRALRSAAILADALHRALSELDPDTQEELIRQTLELAEAALEQHRWEFSRPEPAPVSIHLSEEDLPF